MLSRQLIFAYLMLLPCILAKNMPALRYRRDGSDLSDSNVTAIVIICGSIAMTIIVAVLIYVRKKCCVESKSSDSSIPNRNRSASTQNLIEADEVGLIVPDNGDVENLIAAPPYVANNEPYEAESNENNNNNDTDNNNSSADNTSDSTASNADRLVVTFITARNSAEIGSARPSQRVLPPRLPQNPPAYQPPSP